MRRIIIIALLMCVIAVPGAAEPETDGDCIYTLYSMDGEELTQRGGRMYLGDEYIAGDNRHFRVVEVDDVAFTARAEYLGMAEAGTPVSGPEQLDAVFAWAYSAAAEGGGKGVICMYSTHSDESYVPGDGESSKWEDAGIYDVGDEFQAQLEELGYTVVYSEETFLPHDAGAYSRSAATAEELIKRSPVALFDIHRDGVPAEQYESEVEGEDVSMIRLFVGRSNANRDANMAFAKQIKATADEMYPGLIKDIYMGKGNYNQELYPQALLLEFGTHEIDKDLVLKSTSYMAEVVDEVVSGGAAHAAERNHEENTGAGKGIFWVIAIVIIAALIYALAATGRLGGMWDKFKRGVSEITGGSAGKRK